MKKLQAFRLKMITTYAQLRADTIIHQLEHSKSSFHFNQWFERGAMLNAYMIVFHNVYLD